MKTAHPCPAILIVDDDGDIRDGLADLLTDEGFSVAVAAGGNDALAYLRNCPGTRLILLDYMMPNMNGMEFRAAQLEDEKLAAIPVVLLTAATNARQNAAEMGVDFLIKPLELGSLLNLIQRHV